MGTSGLVGVVQPTTGSTAFTNKSQIFKKFTIFYKHDSRFKDNKYANNLLVVSIISLRQYQRTGDQIPVESF